jgi:hypothetical protein
MVKYAQNVQFFEIIKESKLYYFVKCYKKNEFRMNYDIVLHSMCNYVTYYQFIDELEDETVKILKSKTRISDIEIRHNEVYESNYMDINILPSDSLLLDPLTRDIYSLIYKMIMVSHYLINSNSDYNTKVYKGNLKGNRRKLKTIRKLSESSRSDFKILINKSISYFKSQHLSREDFNVAIDKLILKLKLK